MLVFTASLISVHFSSQFLWTYERRYRGLHRPDCSLCWIFLGRSPRFLWHFVKHLASRMDLIRLKSRASLTFPHMVVHLYAYLAHIGLPTVLLPFGFLRAPLSVHRGFPIAPFPAAIFKRTSFMMRYLRFPLHVECFHI